MFFQIIPWVQWSIVELNVVSADAWFATVLSCECLGTSNHWWLDCSFTSLFRLTTKQYPNSKLLALCERNPLVTCEVPFKGHVLRKAYPFRKSKGQDVILAVWLGLNRPLIYRLRAHICFHLYISWAHSITFIFDPFAKIATSLN